MRINHNIAALNTYRQLTVNNTQTQKALEKLSSGLRINRAGDDAAGLAISEKMRGQIRGLEMASKNAQDGISLIQTAEGALTEVHAILQRMRELAVQAANDTNNDSDRAEIQKEIEQLKSEINRISTDTEFNTKTLLDGSIGQTASLGDNAAEVVDVRAVDSNAEGTFTITISDVAVGTDNFISAGGIAKADVEINNATGVNDIKAGTYTIEITGDKSSVTAILKDAQGNEVGRAAGVDSTSGIVITNSDDKTLVTIAGDTYNGNEGIIKFDVTITADIEVKGPDGSEKDYSGVKADSNSVMTVAGLELDVAANLQKGGVTQVDVKNNGVQFHIGANEGQTTRLAINRIDIDSLKVADVDVRTQSGAEAAITSINKAIETVSSERSKLGAIQNRLEHTINNLGTSAENLTAAESRIRDVDMAKEMMEFTKQSILSQAAQAMLAQANQMPQGVLQLLR